MRRDPGPGNMTIMFMPLIIDVVDPPQPKGRYPVMSPALEQAFREIEKGAEEQLEALRDKKERMEAEEVSTKMVLKLIGHMEKVEGEDVDEEEEQIEGDNPAVGKEVGGGLTADREVTVAGGAEGKLIMGTDTDKLAKSMEKAEESGTSGIK